MAGETILIVEDNDITRMALQALLESDGYKVLSATHGLVALEIMKEARPDLILSDISMPEMDGYELFETVRATPGWIAIPFVFLTARGERQDIFMGKNLGAEDYLIKPVSRQDLLTTVRSRLNRNQQLLFAQLQQVYQSSLIVFSNSIELRDQYTRGHVERVMDFALAIARQMNWTDSQMNALQFGSILHDIGKIHIREEILSKPGPLSTGEWFEMKQHPIVGVELIKNIPYLASAIPVIRHHHERWDGTGYPNGLAGEAIPPAARIVAIADSLDAMTTARVYRKPSAPQEAYEEILDKCGSWYDPLLAGPFQEAWPEIRLRIG